MLIMPPPPYGNRFSDAAAAMAALIAAVSSCSTVTPETVDEAALFKIRVVVPPPLEMLVIRI
jgi:hypothetical protein